MAKTEETKQRKRQSRVVNREAADGEDNSNPDGQTVPSSEQIASKEEGTDMKQDEQDPQKDAVIEVKGSASNVTVSWDEKNGEGAVDDSEKTADASGQMTDSGEHTQINSSADAVSTTEDTETQESEDCQMDITVGERESAVAVTWEEKNEEGERDKQMIVKETKVKGKRKVDSTVETSPSKKTKLINDGFCLFVGNLNTTKKFEEVKDSLANFFMTQSVLVQDIRLDRSRKHAHVDLASEMDLTKALTLNGVMVLDKPMKIDKAKIKDEEKEKAKVKVSPADKKASRDAKCLFLKNVPYDATRKDIMKIFRKAVNVRFPGGAEGPTKGIAFVELKNKAIAKKLLQKKRVFKMQDKVLIVDSVGEAKKPQAATAKDDKTTKAAAPPNNTLFVSNLSFNVNEKNLKSVFQKAVQITVPKSKGKARGFAFVEFATVAAAEEALQSTQNMKLLEREVKAKFYDMQEKSEKVKERSEKAKEKSEKSEKAKVLPTTLVVMGLAEKTSAETLKSAFEGAVSARVILDKETGASKKYGFVDFESEENCKAVKKAMEDCEIDGSKVTVAYANPKGAKGRQGAKGGLAGRPPAGQRAAARGGRKDKGGKGSKGKGTRGGKGHGAGKRKAVKKGGTKG
ncbi:nucleolin-like [Pagrus major]|uniref:nucleolin-like n=1 Tax=Pagrus major TaxID=143350 RepID=UPI003CC8D5E3